MSRDRHDLAALYAIDALDADERADFDVHLRTCAACRAEVVEIRATGRRLAEGAASSPPEELRDRVLERVRSTGQDPAPGAAVDELAGRRRRPSTRVVLAAAAAIVVLVTGAIVLAGVRRGTPSVDDVVAASDAVTTPLALTPDGARGTFEIVWSPGQGRAAVIADGLPEPGDDQVYALWAIVDAPVPAGLFEADDGRVRDVVELAGVEPIAWGVTVEPADGSGEPTTPILFYEEI